MMKKLSALLLLAAALMMTPAIASAHEYDRDDSDHALRYVAYAVYPVGILAEYVILRPIHWLVSQDHANVVFGHDRMEKEDYDYFEWH